MARSLARKIDRKGSWGFDMRLKQQLAIGSTTALGLALALVALPAHAQDAPDSTAAKASGEDAGEAIVVTGSRIRRSATDTTMPLTVVGAQDLTDRGYFSAAQALNNEPAVNRQLAQANGGGGGSGSGVQAPALFGLGTGRTLSLLNGRRMVTTSTGLGDSQVDANVIPTGLLSRVEVVKAGGAAVYGSDAIAGVVNYVLRRDFEGLEADAQASVTSRGDYPSYSARLTGGANFGDGRGNVAVNVDWSKTEPLAFDTRPLTQLSRITSTNSADTGPTDGIPSIREVIPARFWPFNLNGVIYATPAPVPVFLRGQFNADGSVSSYNPGTVLGIPFAIGGDGFPYSQLVGTLRTGIDRIAANAIAHYDLTDTVRLSTELLFARTKATEVSQLQSNTVIGSAAQAAGAVAFTRNNPFLSSSAIASLTTLSPSFGAGAPLFLSKSHTDILADNDTVYTTNIYRGLIGLEGDFTLGGKAFDWSVSGSYGRVEGERLGYDVAVTRFNNAVSAVRNSSGQIVCGINADANTSNDDASCAPLNLFGSGNISDAARAYVSLPTGNTYVNEQVDLLATLGGALVSLPAGDVRFSAAYEHRREEASFTPFAADQTGAFGLSPVVPQSGKYHTNEISGELLVPLVGDDFTLPAIHSLELTGAFRHVANSAAGTENVWNLGGLWQPVPDLTFRASRGRNFRAPTITQLFAPNAQNLQSGNLDPCDADRINGGPNPTQRRTSCLALFTANPTYGTGGPNGAAAGADAATRLAAFQNSGENFTTTTVTTGGNPALRNEISKTWTYGVVVQPRFIPGLTITADRIEIDLQDGLSAFTTQNFAEACYDDPNPAPGVCSAFTRLAVGTAQSQAGSYATGRTTTFNAGVIRFKGETYDVSYNLPLSRLFDGAKGTLDLQAVATHTALLESSVTGAVFTRTDHTALQPRWSGRFDMRYTQGPFRFTYQAYYLGPALAAPNATIENNPNPRLDSNLTHSISFQWDTGKLAFRAGVNNLTDKGPSYPSLIYGDIIGRQFFVGVKAKY
ncbi:MAG: hypothetical protein RL339_2009 [Pseudomonadota bacterium]|jgi:outer membrane receptor protein involved in Fe transport